MADRIADVLLSVVCAALVALGIAALGTAEIHGAQGAGRVALGVGWIALWCWNLAAVWSGWLRMQRRR